MAPLLLPRALCLAFLARYPRVLVLEYATHWHGAGVDLPTVKRISGHKTLAMVERYSHQNGTHIQAAMDKLQARFKLAS